MLHSHLLVKTLPLGVREALLRAGYRKADVEVCVASDVTLSDSASDGERAFAVEIPNVEADRHHTFLTGSYGGRNPYETSWLGVRADRGPQSVPLVGAIIVGTMGRTATVYVSAPTLLRLTAPASAEHAIASDAVAEGRADAAGAIAEEGLAALATPTVTLGERWTLYAYRSLKSGPYRQEYLDRLRNATDGYAGSPGMIANLVVRGLLKRASNGATSITTAGKNAGPKEAPASVHMSYVPALDSVWDLAHSV